MSDFYLIKRKNTFQTIFFEKTLNFFNYLRKKFTEFLTFDTVSPAHINEEYAKSTPFETRIAHGMLSAGFISAVLGMKLSGTGTIYLGQTVKFLAPVHIGDTITAKATVKEVITEKNRVIITTSCVNQNGKDVLTGEATVLAPK